MLKILWSLSFVTSIMSVPIQVLAGLSQSQIDTWYENCKSAKPRRTSPYVVQSLRLGLNVRVPEGYYLIWKDPFGRRDGDLTIVKQERFIGQQCADEFNALHGKMGQGFRGSRYGTLLIYEGAPRVPAQLSLPVVSRVSTNAGIASIHGGRSTYMATIIHPMSRKKITIESFRHPQSAIEETIKHLSFF